MESTYQWRPGVLAAFALLLLALVPQAHLCYKRGGEWRGHFASFEGDEAAYAAYTGALINGRPRLNDPYAGLDDSAATPLAESLFSIQFVPAYALALPARALKLNAPAMFIALGPLVAFIGALALFWLLASLTGDARLAACGTIVILCLGALATGQGRWLALFGLRPTQTYLPFLRRTVPALPFPLFFIFCALIRRALTRSNEPAPTHHDELALTPDANPALTHDDTHALSPDGARALMHDDYRRALTRNDTRAALIYAALAGLTFAVLVFSYFYLWTAAAAWLAGLTMLWLIAHWHDATARAHALKVFLTMGALACLSLAPYSWLLARRGATMDAVQVLQHTHAPDLFRVPELIAFSALLLLACGLWRKRLNARAPLVIFAASFALTPFIVFNQQLITGRSLQPVHYEGYIVNYVALAALFLALALMRRQRDDVERSDGVNRSHHVDRSHTVARTFPAWLLLSVALVAYGWGAWETVSMTRRFSALNVARDKQLRVALRFAEIARESPESHDGAARPVILSTSFMLADNLPVVASQQAVLWSPHMLVNSGLTANEHKRRLYQYFYYTGVAPEDFPRFLAANRFLFYMLFGPDRALPYLTNAHAPVTPAEIAREQESYTAYVAAFTRTEAARPLLSFVVTSPERPFDLAPLDRWYERDAGERVGDYTIYRLRLRPS